MSREISSAYFHINNGGATFKVVDEGYGPVVVLSSSHFGTNLVEHKIHVKPGDLKVLARLFEVAANDRYSETYCCAAKTDRRSCKPCGRYDDLLPEDEPRGCCGGKVMKMSMMQEAAPTSKTVTAKDKSFSDVVGELRRSHRPKRGSLDVYYSSQQVVGEELTGEGVEGQGHVCVYDISREPLLGTVQGVIEIDGLAIQNFTLDASGSGSSNTLGASELWVEEFMLIGKKLCMKWNKSPGSNKVVVSYEYDLEA